MMIMYQFYNDQLFLATGSPCGLLNAVEPCNLYTDEIVIGHHGNYTLQQAVVLRD